tara:strand:+ start:379 stop:558 length:180 start_codon:yes stop_codon:yes gene_type:complete
MRTVTFTNEEYVAISSIIADRLNTFKKNIAKRPDGIDPELNDIRNYITYDLHQKLPLIN